MSNGLGWLGAGTYCAGLLLVSVLVRHWGLGVGAGAIAAGMVLLAGAIAAALGLSQRWRQGPTAGQWLGLGLVAVVAVANYSLRYPTSGPMDISHLLGQGEAAGAQQVVWGTVQEPPKIGRSGRGQLWLGVHQVRRLDAQGQAFGVPETSQGRLYVTLPADQIGGLYPGLRVQVQGKLYAPPLPKNPNAFNFRQFLADRGCFAGFTAERIGPEKGQSEPRWALWRLRQRLARAHERGLGTPAGPLVSAMALGRRAVQVPYDLQDAFVQAGMAHTLAASGFHVSLLLGVVLAVVGHPLVAARSHHPAMAKFTAGSATLMFYVLLTGGQPSVLRAAVMGFGALVGIALERSVRPLGCLLVAVTLLLVIHPGWVDDVGFRLSVMATLGLMVAARPIAARLEGLPTTLAAAAAVPLAAYLWTIPLALYYFNTLTTYSILLNLVTTPLVMVISLGGMVSGAIAVLSPALGALAAWPLGLPAHLLIALVKWEVGLPGSALATGHIGLGQMLGLYGLFVLWGWGGRWWRSRRSWVALAAVLLALGPLFYQGATLARVTVLAAGDDAVLLVQDRRSALLVNSGTDRTGFYTVLPFLRQAGINRLAGAVHGDDSDADNWRTIADRTAIGNFYRPDAALAIALPVRQTHRLAPGQPHRLGRQTIEYLADGERGLRLTLLGHHPWLLLPRLSPDRQLPWLQAHPGLAAEVLWWRGEPLSAALVETLGFRTAIASGRTLDPATETLLRDRGIAVFCTERDGAVGWSPRRGFWGFLGDRQRPALGLD